MINPDIEEINYIVRKYLNVYDFRITPDHLEFYFTPIEEKEFETNFEKLRLEFKTKNLIPIIRKEKGEYVLIVVKTPRRRFMSIWVNMALLLATLASTIWVGMGYYITYYGSSGLWHDIFGGFLYFALPLMTILGIHEMGHYFAAKRHNVAVSLPFFIPAPTILGTLGAFISVREPIPNKKALIDIGLAGPIAGFIAAIPITLLGMYLGNINPPIITPQETSRYLLLNVPIIYNILAYFMPSSGFINPMAMAGWVGFIVTAINLFPIGQLDGGHVARAIAGNKTKYVSYGFAGILFVLGMWYPGWIIFALLVIFLGLNHPPPLNDITKLDKKRWALAISGILLLAVTFVPIPMQMVTLHEDIELSASVDSNILVENLNNYTTLHIFVENKGEMKENVTINITGNLYVSHNRYNFLIDKGSNWTREITIGLKEKGKNILVISLFTKTGYSKKVEISILCLKVSKELYFNPNKVHTYSFNTTLINKGNLTKINFISLNNIYFNITNSSIPLINKNTIIIQKDSHVNLHFVVGGKTIILAINLVDYETGVLRVIV